MRKSVITIAAAAFIGGGIVTTVARSEEKAAVPAASKEGDQQSMQEMMKMFEKMGAVNEHHARMKPLVGTFDADVTIQMPGMPPENSKGRTRNELIFGGRFLKGEYSGTFMGKPFNGMQILGYDNLKSKYVSHWLDDMSTVIMVAEGKGEESGNTITTYAPCPDPATNGKKIVRQVMTIVDDDHNTMECFEPGPDGKDIKTMSTKYARVK
jgi:hypothetical protein